MILHPLFPSNFAMCFNKKRLLLNYNIEMIGDCAFTLNQEYWEINIKEEQLCNEDDLVYKNYNFNDD